MWTLFRDKQKEAAELWHAHPTCVCGNSLLRVRLQEKHGKVWITTDSSWVKYYCTKCGGLTEGPHYDGYLEGYTGWIVKHWVDSVQWMDNKTRFCDNAGKVVFRGR